MAENKIDKSAEARAASSRDATSDSVVELLTSILTEVRQQVQSETPKPLEGDALDAVARFREIVAALALQAKPTLVLTADPPQGDSVTLRWTSTDAQSVSLEKEVGGKKTPLGELTPAAGGSKQFLGNGVTTFTATAVGPCARAVESVVVELSN
jgi:hypothetical protein